MITYTDGSSCGGGHGLLEHLDGHGRGTDRLQPLLAIPLRAPRIQHADDHLLDAVAAARDLGDDQVRVVAVGRGDEGVGLRDPGLGEGVDLQPGTDGEAPTRLLPRRVELVVEPFVRQRVLVEDRHLVALGERPLGDGRPDPAGPQDEDEHEADSSGLAVRPLPLGPSDYSRSAASASALSVSAPSRFAPSGSAPSGVAAGAAARTGAAAAGAAEVTRAGALPTAQRVISPMKLCRGPPRPPST